MAKKKTVTLGTQDRHITLRRIWRMCFETEMDQHNERIRKMYGRFVDAVAGDWALYVKNRNEDAVELIPTITSINQVRVSKVSPANNMPYHDTVPVQNMRLQDWDHNRQFETKFVLDDKGWGWQMSNRTFTTPNGTTFDIEPDNIHLRRYLVEHDEFEAARMSMNNDFRRLHQIIVNECDTVNKLATFIPNALKLLHKNKQQAFAQNMIGGIDPVRTVHLDEYPEDTRKLLAEVDEEIAVQLALQVLTK